MKNSMLNFKRKEVIAENTSSGDITNEDIE